MSSLDLSSENSLLIRFGRGIFVSSLDLTSENKRIFSVVKKYCAHVAEIVVNYHPDRKEPNPLRYGSIRFSY